MREAIKLAAEGLKKYWILERIVRKYEHELYQLQLSRDEEEAKLLKKVLEELYIEKENYRFSVNAMLHTLLPDERLKALCISLGWCEC